MKEFKNNILDRLLNLVTGHTYNAYDIKGIINEYILILKRAGFSEEEVKSYLTNKVLDINKLSFKTVLEKAEELLEHRKEYRVKEKAKNENIKEQINVLLAKQEYKIVDGGYSMKLYSHGFISNHSYAKYIMKNNKVSNLLVIHQAHKDEEVIAEIVDNIITGSTTKIAKENKDDSKKEDN